MEQDPKAWDMAQKMRPTWREESVQFCGVQRLSDATRQQIANRKSGNSPQDTHQDDTLMLDHNEDGFSEEEDQEPREPVPSKEAILLRHICRTITWLASPILDSYTHDVDSPNQLQNWSHETLKRIYTAADYIVAASGGMKLLGHSIQGILIRTPQEMESLVQELQQSNQAAALQTFLKTFPPDHETWNWVSRKTENIKRSGIGSQGYTMEAMGQELNTHVFYKKLAKLKLLSRRDCWESENEAAQIKALRRWEIGLADRRLYQPRIKSSKNNGPAKNQEKTPAKSSNSDYISKSKRKGPQTSSRARSPSSPHRRNRSKSPSPYSKRRNPSPTSRKKSNSPYRTAPRPHTTKDQRAPKQDKKTNHFSTSPKPGPSRALSPEKGNNTKHCSPEPGPSREKSPLRYPALEAWRRKEKEKAAACSTPNPGPSTPSQGAFPVEKAPLKQETPETTRSSIIMGPPLTAAPRSSVITDTPCAKKPRRDIEEQPSTLELKELLHSMIRRNQVADINAANQTANQGKLFALVAQLQAQVQGLQARADNHRVPQNQTVLQLSTDRGYYTYHDPVLHHPDAANSTPSVAPPIGHQPGASSY